MIVLGCLLLAAWITAAPDRRTLAARGGATGAARWAVRGAAARTRAEWARGGPVRAKKRSKRRTKMRKSGYLGSAAVWLELTAVRAGKATRSVGRIAVAGAKAAPDGYREGSVRAVEARTERKERRAASKARREERFINPEPVDDASLAEEIMQKFDKEPLHMRPDDEMAREMLDKLRRENLTEGEQITGLHRILPNTGPYDCFSPPTETGEGSTPSKENKIMTVTTTEINTTTDLRNETVALEAIAEQFHGYATRVVALVENASAANFNTRRIAAALTALEDASLEDAAEALAELRLAVDEAQALVDAAEALGATGDVDNFTAA